MNESQLIKEYNDLRDMCQNKPAMPAKEFLAGLTDHELTVFIAGKTYRFGRDFQSSWDNALSHMKNRQQANLLWQLPQNRFRCIQQ